MQGWQGPGPLPPRSPMCVCRNVCGFYIKFWCLLCTRVCCCGWRGRGPCPEPCPDPHRFPSGTRLWHRDVVLGQGPGAQHSPRAWEAASSAPSRRAGAGSPPRDQHCLAPGRTSAPSFLPSLFWDIRKATGGVGWCRASRRSPWGRRPRLADTISAAGH